MHEESSQLGLEISWNKTKIQNPESIQGAPSMVPVLGHQVEVVDSFIYIGSCIETWWEWYGYLQMNRAGRHMHEGTELWNMTHVYLIVNQVSFILYGVDTWSITVLSKWHIDAFDQWCLAHPIHGTCHQSGSPLQNRSTASHFPCKVAMYKAVWPYCRSRTGSRLCTRTASFHQSSPRGLAPNERSSMPVVATISRSWSKATQLWPLYSMSIDVWPIVLPGGVLWKQPCTLTGAPLHDDDE